MFKFNMNSFKKLSLLLLGSMMVFASCSKDKLDDAELDTYAEELVFRTQEAANMGPFGCYELVFPVTLVFPDRTLVEVDSYEEMRMAARRWRQANPRVRQMAQLQFPYELITEEGEILYIESLQHQRRARLACQRSFFDNNDPTGHNDRPQFCFRIVFPLTLHFPDGQTTMVEGREEMNVALRRWAQANPDSDQRPVIGLPFTVMLRDGRTILINTRNELADLRRRCREG
jgi:hypothetical protein